MIRNENYKLFETLLENIIIVYLFQLSEDE